MKKIIFNKVFFSILFSVFLSFTFFSHYSFASETSTDLPKFLTVDNLRVASFNYGDSEHKEIINVKNHYDFMLTHFSSADAQNQFKELFNNAMSGGTIFIGHVKKTSGIGREYITYYLNEKDYNTCNFVLYHYKDHKGYNYYAIKSPPGKDAACYNWRQVIVENNDKYKFYSYINTSKISQFSISGTLINEPRLTISTFLFSSNYDLDSSLNGYNPSIPNSIGSSDSQNFNKKIISPEFNYKVEDKKITINHLKDKDQIELSAFSKYTKDGWKLKNNNYQIKFTVQHKLTGDVIGTTQIIDPGGQFSISVPQNGEYSINASYSALSCYSYGPSSSTPDYCINAYPDDTDKIDYQSKTMYLNINGDSFEGSTLTADCKSGFCQIKPEYEDCSVHDLNIKFWDGGPEFRFPSILSIGCTINNSLKWLVNEVILPLFIPSQDFLRDKFSELQNNLQKSFGFLWTPITIIQTFYDGVINNQISGNTCSLPPMTIFGSTATIHLCAWRYQLPELWRYMQLAIQGGLVVGLIWSLYRLVMNFFGVRVDDDEEDDSGFEDVRWRDDRTGDTGSWERRSKR